MLHLNFEELKLDRALIEVRFKDNFKVGLQEVRFKMLEKLTKKYAMYDSENAEALAFFNPEKKIHLVIQLNRCAITCEEPTNLIEFIKSAKADFSFIFKQLEIDSLLRVGMRTFNFFEGPDQKAIEQFIFKEYLSAGVCSPDFAEEYFSPEIKLSGKKNGLLFNLAISHQQHQVIEGIINEVMNNKITNSLVVDFDCYKENTRVSKFETLLTTAHSLNNDCLAYLKAVKKGAMV
ncbi:TIGR04255 family protein [Bacillus cereus group sp. BY8-1LC]|uniref:TIGR04255 family protein n=1 Tax=Bacillus cereus group sp. BY8-1LC TaxID=3018076 RepID=UPI0022E1C749|nr:TIGR04255 family protein [Bacillus cereus group sp. BY8-1LC]MDA1797572.1 TIGR04255 family protein [Bacillus cereus group sp. BY8-1LC]